MLTARKVAADRRHAFLVGARHFVNTKVAEADRGEALKVVEAAVAAAGEITHRLNHGSSREQLQLKVALASQGINV